MVFARGDIQAAQVTAQGTSMVTLSGVTKTVDADLSGISKLYVDAASGVYGCWTVVGQSPESWLSFVARLAVPF